MRKYIAVLALVLLLGSQMGLNVWLYRELLQTKMVVSLMQDNLSEAGKLIEKLAQVGTVNDARLDDQATMLRDFLIRVPQRTMQKQTLVELEKSGLGGGE